MKAIAFRGVHDVRVESIAEPRVVEPTDALVRITTIITHTLPLGDAPRGYKIFDQKEDRAIKVLLKP